MLESILRQRGVTLVELMIASAIGLIAIAAILTVYAATVRHSKEQLEAAHLHHQLFGLLHLISTDIHRAGYWHFDTSTQAASNNPFVTGENSLRSQAYPDENDNSCILFAYDLDKDGRVGIGQCDDEPCSRQHRRRQCRTVWLQAAQSLCSVTLWW